MEDHHGVRKYFYFIKEKVSSDWKDLAFHLGVGPEDIRNIDRKNQDDKSCCMDLLEEWLKRKGERATIEVLMEALSEANLQSIVDELKIKYPELAAQRQPVGANQGQTESIKAPEGLKALETTNDSVKLGWTEVSSTQADGYRLEQSIAFEPKWVSAQGDRKLLPATITEFTVVDLIPYKEYHFCVRSAIDRMGELVLSERSVPLYVVAKQPYQPYRPRNLKLTDCTHASLSLTWKEPSPADDVNPVCYEYVVEMCAHGNDQGVKRWTEYCRTTQCNCPINDQDNGIYRFRVSTNNTEMKVISLPEEMGDPIIPIHIKTKSEWLIEVLKTFWPFSATTQPRSQESGSIIFNISCHDLEGLRELWMNYKLGKVNKFFGNFFARLARLTSVQADTELEIRIDKEDFYSCRRHLLLTRPTSMGFRIVRLGEGHLRGIQLGLSEDYPVYCKPISHKTTCSQLDFLDPAIPVDQQGLNHTISAGKVLALSPLNRQAHCSSLPGLDRTKHAVPQLHLKETAAQRQSAQSVDISEQHSKHGFKAEELKLKKGDEAVRGSSIPLILPNDLKYDASTGRVYKLHDVPRKTLHVVPEALELLERIDEPVSVLAICGPCRTGKSYILSRLLGEADAFALGHTMDPKTFGIWMGTKVLRGKDFTIVLLDTEGIDAVGGSAGQDASILVMTILLSSYLIYNSLNVPHQKDLEKMQCFTQLAKRVTVKQSEKTKKLAFQEFFPDFLWLLRDVSLKMEDENGREMAPTEYLLTKVLRCQSDEDDSEDESTSDKVGRAIRTFFPSVECAKLVRPSGDEEVMNNIAQHTESLKTEFTKGVHALIERLLQKSRAKRGYEKNSTVRGLHLSIMTKQYVDAVNDPNSIPALDNTWKNTIELMQSRANDEAVTEYNKQMQSQIAAATNNGLVPLEENTENEMHLTDLNTGHSTSLPTLMGLHNKVLDDVTKMLLEKVGHFGVSSEDPTSENKKLVDRLQNRLVQKEKRSVDCVAADGTTKKQEGFVVTGGELLQYIQKNRELSKNFCKDLSEHLVGQISGLLAGEHVDSPSPSSSPTFDFDKLLRMVEEAYKQYEQQACGPEKWIVQQEMAKNLQKLKVEIEKYKAFRTEMLQAEQRAAEAENQAKQLREKADEMQQQQQNQAEKIRALEQDQQTQLQLKIAKVQREWKEQHEVELKKIEENKKRAEDSEFESSKLKEEIRRKEAEMRAMDLKLTHESGSNKDMSKKIQDMQQTQQETERRHREQINKMKREIEDRQTAQERQNAEREKKEQEEREHLRNALSEKDKTIQKKEQIIREKDQTIKQKEETIQQKEETIQKKEQDLANVSRACSLL
ncbi:uncharacterized protein LOC144866343 [Branchiostoma floridae x Branchiostoma japonicum]